jgi:hypothetical protein
MLKNIEDATIQPLKRFKIDVPLGGFSTAYSIIVTELAQNKGISCEIVNSEKPIKDFNLSWEELHLFVSLVQNKFT